MRNERKRRIRQQKKKNTKGSIRKIYRTDKRTERKNIKISLKKKRFYRVNFGVKTGAFLIQNLVFFWCQF